MLKLLKKKTKQGNKKNSFVSNIFAIIVALFIALLFRSFFYQAFVIPSGSMEPNLLIGDYLFVSKYDYGYSRYSFPFGLFGLGGDSRVFYKEPKRGDIVIFKYPSNPNEDFVKRVIGLPGDKVQVIGGVVYLNDKPLKNKVIGTENRGGIKYTILEETLPDGKSFKIYKDYSIYNPANNTQAYYVKKDHFFVMGDNRDYSRDSRFRDVGQIPKVNLEGKARVIFFSINGYFLQFWKWNQIRFNRIFNTIS